LAWAALQEVGRENDSKFDPRAQRFCHRDVELLEAAARHATGNLASGPDTVEDGSVDAGPRMPRLSGIGTLQGMLPRLRGLQLAPRLTIVPAQEISAANFAFTCWSY
jgi:hypothetical protein